jgi:hypothetical protein
VVKSRAATVTHRPATAGPARRRLALVLLTLHLAGCRGLEGDVLVAPTDGASGAATCPTIAQTILLLDRDGRLASYDPRADLLRDLASVAANVRPAECAAARVSLARDRQGAAWISSCDGDLLRCDPSSGLCAGGQANTTLVGSIQMAWATEPSGAQALFLAVPTGRISPPSPPRQSRLFKFPDLQTPLATLAGWPTLTGTAEGLWALFPGEPGPGGTPPRLVALDPASGREVSSREPAGILLEPVRALLAASGRDLWVFQATGAVTRVQRIGGTGPGNDTARSIPREVVGAASSTCSP